MSSLFRGQFELGFADSCDQGRPVAMLAKVSKQRDRTMRHGDIDDAGHLPSESRSTRPSLQLLVQSANSDSVKDEFGARDNTRDRNGEYVADDVHSIR